MTTQSTLPATRQPKTKQFRLTQEVIVYTTHGNIFTTSLEIANRFGKNHQHVLRTIRGLECSKDFSLSNFGQSDYTDDRGKQQPMYNVTRDSFIFLVTGFTGKEAARWKEKFIAEFNRMERLLRQPAINKADLQTAIAS
ncbi:MAG: Rha family transcriptional regulator [Nitrospirae bacterium]|nr:Rha family transcriptional regulator [Nitrospirota bacterium]